MLEGITYATATGKDNMDPLVPVIGSLASGTFSIGRNYHGFLDEFRISKELWIILFYPDSRTAAERLRQL